MKRSKLTIKTNSVKNEREILIIKNVEQRHLQEKEHTIHPRDTNATKIGPYFKLERQTVAEERSNKTGNKMQTGEKTGTNSRRSRRWKLHEMEVFLERQKIDEFSLGT